MYFEIIGEVTDIEIIAKGRGIHELARLEKKYGRGQWRKLKGKARVRLENGTLRRADVHWYEAQGIGSKRFKLKRFLD
jgi:hypothetical protein